jgi:putative two-component system hydrogenase maturation factor HypX/HoxX
VRILLLCTSYNSLTQRAHTELTSSGHAVAITLSTSEQAMRDAVAFYEPDLVLCPYLKERVPADIWSNYLCIVVHPGIKGDRGPSSLDWAILDHVELWGVTALQCAEEMDAGDIWASTTFPMRVASKSSIYRHEVTEAALQVILESVKRHAAGNFRPESLDYTKADVRGTLRPSMKQKDRRIDWSADTTDTIIRKVNASDSDPGVLDTIGGKACYLYGAHMESRLRGRSGEIIAQRNGAICLGTVDGAVWISHLKRKSEGTRAFFKLPATIVLENAVKMIPESPIELLYTGTDRTFREIWYEEENQVGYLYFDFYNGALSTSQCQRLTQAFLAAVDRPTKVIVLMGGTDFWSNGIHLNMIEATDDPAGESWLNINAMNDLVHTILTTHRKLILSAIRGNAAAGGLMLALAADKIYARSGVVLNPHYKSMGLFGSEYWTYLLPRRVGLDNAQRLTEQCLPIGVEEAKAIGLVDGGISGELNELKAQMRQHAETFAQSADYEQRLVEKNERHRRDNTIKPLGAHRAEELARMSENFYGPDRSYHEARRKFVYKIRSQVLPRHLAKHNTRLHSPKSKCHTSSETLTASIVDLTPSFHSSPSLTRSGSRKSTSKRTHRAEPTPIRP